MKTIVSVFWGVFVCTLLTSVVSAEQKLASETIQNLFMKKMIPIPVSAKFFEGDSFRIADDCNVEVYIKSEEHSSRSIRKGMEAVFEKYWDISADIEVQTNAKIELDSEAYKIECSNKLLKIYAGSKEGAFHALRTLRQLSESERGKTDFDAYTVPQMKIEDCPALPFRAVHLCYFPETKFFEFERCIRLAAYYKMNYVVVEFWGTYPFKDYPQFSWPDRTLSRKDIEKIADLADELNITIIPQFNMLGHASASREVGGKHVALDFHKELQNHFEPEGWSWCLSNPDTQEMLVNMMIDLHDTFGRPPFFHIGFDESYEVGTCSLCRKTAQPSELIKSHIKRLHSVMKERNTRLIMWHDMLLEKEDARWTGFNVCGHAAQNLTNLHLELPRDIVIADWQYEYPSKNGKEPTWPTTKYFKSLGYDTLVCPWKNMRGAASLGKFAKNEKLFGNLATTWGSIHGLNMQKIFAQAAYSGWGCGTHDINDRKNRMSFNHHVNQMNQDMECKSVLAAGYSNNEDIMTQ